MHRRDVLITRNPPRKSNPVVSLTQLNGQRADSGDIPWGDILRTRQDTYGSFLQVAKAMYASWSAMILIVLEAQLMLS